MNVSRYNSLVLSKELRTDYVGMCRDFVGLVSLWRLCYYNKL